jgi:hypothetical protein
MMELDLSKALRSLRPGASWGLNGNSYGGLEWDDTNELPPPTEEELIAEAQRIENEFQNNEYQRLREREYPDFREYLDGVIKGNQEQIQSYINKCLAVKAKYPKPEGVE